MSNKLFYIYLILNNVTNLKVNTCTKVSLSKLHKHFSQWLLPSNLFFVILTVRNAKGLINTYIKIVFMMQINIFNDTTNNDIAFLQWQKYCAYNLNVCIFIIALFS